MKRLFVVLLGCILLGTGLTPIAASAQVICQSADSDPDGDGWGWENGQSCRVSDDSSGGSSGTPAGETTPDGCDYSDAASNGGWGWDAANNRSCPPRSDDGGSDSGSTGGNPTDPGPTDSESVPSCSANAEDPDGDGWGWENGQSCRVVAGSTGPGSTGPGSSSGGYPPCSADAVDPDGDGYGWENGGTCLVASQKEATEAQSTYSSSDHYTYRLDGMRFTGYAPELMPAADGLFYIRGGVVSRFEPQPQTPSEPVWIMFIIASNRDMERSGDCGGSTPEQCAYNSVVATLNQLDGLSRAGADINVRIYRGYNQVIRSLLQDSAGFQDHSYYSPAEMLQRLDPSLIAGTVQQQSTTSYYSFLETAASRLSSESGQRHIVMYGESALAPNQPSSDVDLYERTADYQRDRNVQSDIVILSDRAGSCSSRSKGALYATGSCIAQNNSAAVAVVDGSTASTSNANPLTNLPITSHKVELIWTRRPHSAGEVEQTESGYQSYLDSDGDFSIRMPSTPGLYSYVLTHVAGSDIDQEFRRGSFWIGEPLKTWSEFRGWLRDLTEDEIRDGAIIWERTPTELIGRAADPTLGFNEYRVRHAINPFAVVGSPKPMFGTLSYGSGSTADVLDAEIGIVRDRTGTIVDFDYRNPDILFDLAEDQLWSYEGGLIGQFIDFAGGCYASAAEAVTAMKELFLQIWGGWDTSYLSQMAAAIGETVQAFLRDPMAFFEEFLRQIVRADEYVEGNRAEWAGMLACDLAFGVISGGTTGLVAKLLTRLPEIREFDGWNGSGPDSSPGQSCVVGGRGNLPEGAMKILCPTVEPRYFDVEDTRFRGPGPFSISSKLDKDGSRIFSVEGQVHVGHGHRAYFERSGYAAPGELGLPTGQYDRAHLAGPGGMGHESGQILYATKDFNRRYQSTVESQIQKGFKLATARGWTTHYRAVATTYPNIYHGGLLKTIDYEVWFETPSGPKPYLKASGAADPPTGWRDTGQPGATTTEFIFVTPEFR